MPNSTSDIELFSTLQRLCGQAAANRLRERFGGSNLYVPLSISADHPIALCIGLAPAEELSREAGGVTYSVARGGVKQRTRDDLIRFLSLARLPVWAIARVVDLSVRHVSTIRAELRSVGQLPGQPT